MFITNLLLITNNKNTQTITITKMMKMITVSMNMEHGCAGVYYLKYHNERNFLDMGWVLNIIYKM